MIFVGYGLLAITKTEGDHGLVIMSCEAEYITASTVACQGITASTVEIRAVVQRSSSTTKSAIQLHKNPVFHDRRKHIETQFQFFCANDIHTDEQLWTSSCPRHCNGL